MTRNTAFFIILLTMILALAGCTRDSEPEGLPQVSLELTDADLWSPDRGIYSNSTKRGDEWERPAHWTFRRPGGVQWSANVRVRIDGRRSRILAQKNFLVDFEHGDGLIEKDLFGSHSTRFAHVILRSVQTPARCLHTHVVESIFQDLGHLGSRIQPVVMTLNDRPWGIYSLRERYDNEFVRETMGHLGPYDLIRDGETRHGDGDAWWAFLDSFREPADRTSKAWLAGVEKQIDLGSYMDWLIINVVGAAAYTGGTHNLSLLRLDGGPWQVLMWGEDDLFIPENLHSNHWRWFAAADEEQYEQFKPYTLLIGNWESREPWAVLFRGLLENPGFRQRFFARADDLLATELSVAQFSERVRSVVSLHDSAIFEHSGLWVWGGKDRLQVRADGAVAWYTARHGIVVDQLKEFRSEW